jgi:multidrug efflux pump subunit AcrA (membrane-fusion protein)
MWIRIPGSNKPAVCLAGVLALVWLAWGGHPAWAGDTARASDEVQASTPAAGKAQTSEIEFMGKFSCPVKRRVDLEFEGVITSLKVHAGQQVKAGQVLARYRLTPEAVMQLRRRLSPPQVGNLEVKLAEVENSYSQARAKYREVAQLAAQKLASPQALAQTEKEEKLLLQQRQAVQSQLRQERELGREDRQILKEQLGSSLSSVHLPKEGVLRAPINGYVLEVNPDLREGAKLEAKATAFQVGVMDPLVVKAQVHEMESLKVAVGDLGEISPESLPGQKFEARVSRLSWLPLKTGLEQPSYYEVEFSVPNPDLTLKDGMKVRIVLHKVR